MSNSTSAMPHSTPQSEPTSNDKSQQANGNGHHSDVPQIRKTAIISNAAATELSSSSRSTSTSPESTTHRGSLAPPPNSFAAHALHKITNGNNPIHNGHSPMSDSSVSPTSTAPSSPHLLPIKQTSGTSTPRTRNPPTTLNVPGMTSSRVSPDGRIADVDVASKLVIVMVGLPARGKSYITKKLVRYLTWQQHNAKIFNVGNRRRKAAGSNPQTSESCERDALHGRRRTHSTIHGLGSNGSMDAATKAAHILMSKSAPQLPDDNILGEPAVNVEAEKTEQEPEAAEQTAEFFDPKNEQASKLREQVAMSTLDELLDYLLNAQGSVGILDATNSTIARRKLIVDHIREREPKLGIVFIESVCKDQDLLEANMWLKLSGPDYKNKDPKKSLEDFRKRVAAYETAYVELGKWEEENDMPYIQMIDVGKKIVSYGCKSFLTSNIAHYLNTFNLAPRQIWITRHGQSYDNVVQKLGGDSDITPEGQTFGRVLYNFVTQKRREWLIDQKDKVLSANFPPQAGDHTPPYPELKLGELDQKNFCVWTSMLRRSIATAQDFMDDDDYDCKTWKDLNELNAGKFEGLTYEEIERDFPDEYSRRTQDKLCYRYPGVGGEGYLQVIARLRDMVREIERITDHVLVIGHRSICRVLMAYFMDIGRDKVADLNVPLGDVFCIEPKPYGHEFHAYSYDAKNQWFVEIPDWKPEKETIKGN